MLHYFSSMAQLALHNLMGRTQTDDVQSRTHVQLVLATPSFLPYSSFSWIFMEIISTYPRGGHERSVITSANFAPGGPDPMTDCSAFRSQSIHFPSGACNVFPPELTTPIRIRTTSLKTPLKIHLPQSDWNPISYPTSISLQPHINSVKF